MGPETTDLTPDEIRSYAGEIQARIGQEPKGVAAVVETTTKVVITDVKMPLFSMAVLFLKAVVAAIPALILVVIIWGFLSLMELSALIMLGSLLKG